MQDAEYSIFLLKINRVMMATSFPLTDTLLQGEYPNATIQVNLSIALCTMCLVKSAE